MSFPKVKGELPLPQDAPQKGRSPASLPRLLLGLLLIIFGLYNYASQGTWMQKAKAQCPQPSELVPENNFELWQSIGNTIATDAFKTRSIDWLAGAVRVPTESYDKMGPIGVDPRWEAFGPFHDYLLSAFPLVHTTLQLTKVNTYGLLYTWVGKEPSKKPLLLAAHQDVVPVHPDTVDEWVHPPYSGHYDGEKIWGRGSSDDKSGLVGILSTIETLIEQGFRPSRTIVLSFGFDEEASGLYGAHALAKALTTTFGDNAFAMIVDEGSGFREEFGTAVATLGIAEKGYIDTRIEVTAPGGHSSIPPKHTSIGMLASILVEFESHPIVSHLERTNPVYGTLQCLAEHSESLPKSLKKIIKKSVSSDKALKRLEKEIFEDTMYKSLIGTTQAIDLIQGGVKTNALPELAWAVVNHRISTTSSVAATKERDTLLLKSLANKFNLTYSAFGTQISDIGPSVGTLTLSDAWGTALEPAPITPTGSDAAAYQLLSGTIKATYNSHRSLKGDNIAISPGIMSGNTDTRYYWNLSKHIFRYNHHNQGNSSNPLGNGVHTVNEAIGVDAFLEEIRFFVTLILNADEATNL